MSFFDTLRGTFRIMAADAANDFILMNHKIPRILVGVSSFAVMALFYLYFLSAIMPF